MFTGVADFFSWLLAVVLVYGLPALAEWLSWTLVFTAVALPSLAVWRWLYRPWLERIEAAEDE